MTYPHHRQYGTSRRHTSQHGEACLLYTSMADTEKDGNRAAAAPQEEASAAQAAPEAPQPETQDAEKTEKKEKHTEGKAKGCLCVRQR